MDTSDLTQLAVNLARNCGYAVFPTTAGKVPVVKWGKAASTDPEAIRRMFARPGAELIAIATGHKSGVDVLDIDIKHGAACAWWKVAKPLIPPTRVYATRSGGIHAYFQHSEGLTNSQSKLARGVDVRGDGGMAMFWYAAGFECLDAHKPAPWPAWLLTALQRKKEPPAPPPGRRYDGQGAKPHDMVRRTLNRLEAAAEGHRHEVLRGAACTLGGLLDAVGMPAAEAERLLLDAVVRAGGNRVDQRNAISTIRWGLRRGAASPLIGRAA